jgi:hypothetical protein
MSNKDEKARLLDFLQKSKFDISRQIPGFIDARISNKKGEEPRVVLRVASPLVEDPRFEHDGEIIPLEVKVDYPDSKPVEGKVVVGIGDAQISQTVPTSDQDDVGVTVVPIKRAIGSLESGGRVSEAFDQWKKRHRIKVHR